MLHEISPNRQQTSHVPALLPRRQTSDWEQPAHILVPTALRHSERQAVTLGVQLAGAVGTRVTLLHVVPPPPEPEQANPWNWLDALDNLHRSLSSDVHPEAPRANVEQLSLLVADYLETELPGYSQCHAEIHVECREGDVAGEILRFVTTECVDLVILSSDFSYWGLPVVPPRIQRLLQEMDKRVIVVRRDDVAQTKGARISPDRNGKHANKP